MTYSVRFDGVSKQYKLGVLGAGSLRGALGGLIRGRSQTGKNDFYALKDISFELRSGESVGLVGPNGAGKSTTLRLIAGITEPTSGHINVNGRLANLLELGAGFHPELTGRENIFLYGSILGLKRHEIRKAYDSIVAFSELEMFLDTPVKRYSSGMYVRLAFAVAAHVEPEILLVDEVLAVGDAAFRQKCLDRMTQMLGGGVTLVFVSHNSHMVQSICRRAIYINQGQIALDGDVETVLRKYESDLRRGTLSRARSRIEDETDEIGTFDLGEILITDDAGRAKELFKFDETALIRVEYIARQPVRSPIFTVRLFRDDGVACFTARSNQPGMQLQIDSLKNEGAFSLKLKKLQLYGGNYRAMVAIGDGKSVLGMGYSDWFQVDGPGNIDLANERLGIYVPEASWELN